MKRLSSSKIGARQKKVFLAILGGCAGLAAIIIALVQDDSKTAPKTSPSATDVSFHAVSQELDPKTIRLSSLEQASDELCAKLEQLESSLLHLQETNGKTEAEAERSRTRSLALERQMQELEEEIFRKEELPKPPPPSERRFNTWGGEEKKEGRHVSFEIPAGTVVKALLVSGADCSVAVQKPTGPNMVLLRPLDNGNLPRNVRVPLKGSVIIGNAIGDISSERVYIRAERMSLVERGGAFVETELSAYVSGEDGREGMRGIVVDRSGQIIARAAFAAFLQGASQAAEAAFNMKALEKEDKAKYILGSGALQGGSTALNRMADYYIKRAEQLQPAIQIAAGRVVDIVFTKTVKIGEKNLKKKLDMERASKRSGRE